MFPCYSLHSSPFSFLLPTSHVHKSVLYGYISILPPETLLNESKAGVRILVVSKGDNMKHEGSWACRLGQTWKGNSQGEASQKRGRLADSLPLHPPVQPWQETCHFHSHLKPSLSQLPTIYPLLHSSRLLFSQFLKPETLSVARILWRGFSCDFVPSFFHPTPWLWALSILYTP